MINVVGVIFLMFFLLWQSSAIALAQNAHAFNRDLLCKQILRGGLFASL